MWKKNSSEIQKLFFIFSFYLFSITYFILFILMYLSIQTYLPWVGCDTSIFKQSTAGLNCFLSSGGIA